MTRMPSGYISGIPDYLSGLINTGVEQVGDYLDDPGLIQPIAPIAPAQRPPPFVAGMEPGSWLNALRVKGVPMTVSGRTSAGPGSRRRGDPSLPALPAGRASPEMIAMANRMLQGPPGRLDPVQTIRGIATDTDIMREFGDPNAGMDAITPGWPMRPGIPRQLGRGPERTDSLTIEELPASRDAAMEAMSGKRFLAILPGNMDAMKKEHQEDLYRSHGFQETPEGWRLPDHLDPPGETTSFGGGWKRHLRGRDKRMQDLRDIAAGRTPLRMRSAPMAGRMPFHRFGNRRGQGESFFGVGAQMARNRQAKLDEYWRQKEEGGNYARHRASQAAKERRQMMDQMTGEEVIHNYGGRRAFAEEVIDPETGIVLEPETMYNPDSWRPILVTDARGRQKRKWIRKKPGGQTSRTISRPRQRGSTPSSGPRLSPSMAVSAIPSEVDRIQMEEIIADPNASILSSDVDTRVETRSEARRIIATIKDKGLRTYLTKLMNEHMARE